MTRVRLASIYVIKRTVARRQINSTETLMHVFKFNVVADFNLLALQSNKRGTFVASQHTCVQ